MIPNPCIEVQTSPVDRASVPPWFAEVVILARHLAEKGLLDAFAHQVRLVRGHFSRYEAIDFLALLVGYAISGERTLADFFERVAPFAAAFTALFGRKCLPHRSSLSRFLADVDRPCVEAFRTLFERYSFAEGWTTETIGGIFDRQGRRFIVFDVDATRQAARQRALPCAAELPPPRRRLDAVCAPGYTGRKRGEVVRTRTTARRDAHPSVDRHVRRQGQWRLSWGTRLGTTSHHNICAAVRVLLGDGPGPPRRTIWRRLCGGPDPVGHVHVVTRGRGYQLLEHPQIQRVLAHPPTARVSRMNTGEVVELFDGGWLPLAEGLPLIRVIVARHPAPPAGKSVTVGKRIDAWVYELFLTDLDADGFLAEDILDLYHGRGAFEAVLADEDVEEDPDRWCSCTECGQELWQIAVNGYGTCASHWDKRCKKPSSARWSGPLPKKLLPWLCLWKIHLKSMVPGSGPQRSDEPRDASGLMPSPCKRMENCAVQRGQACG